MTDVRVVYADLEILSQGQPTQLTLKLVRLPDGSSYIPSPPDDIPADFLDALRSWLWNAPSGDDYQYGPGAAEEFEEPGEPDGEA